MMIGSFGGGFGRGLGGFSFDPRKIPTAGDLGRFGLGGFPAPVSVAPPPVIPAPPPVPPPAPSPAPPRRDGIIVRPNPVRLPTPVPPPPVTPRPQPVAPAPSPITSPPPAPVTPPRVRPNRFQEEAARKAAEKAAADAAARKAAQAEADRKAAIEAARKARVAEERRAAEKAAKEAADRKAKAEAERKAAEAAAKKRAERVTPTPVPVTPPNRVGQPVSGGEFIPEPTTPSPVTTAPTAPTAESIKTRGENKPIAAKDAIESYKNTLLSAADENVYDTVDDVDEVDDFYDRVFRNTVIDPLDPKAAIDRSMSREGIQAEGIDKAIKTQDARKKPKLDFTPDQYLSEVGGPEYLKGLKSGVGVNTDVVKSAFGTIANTSGTDTAAALSNYYGFEITPSVGESNISNFGGNYEEHTTASQAEIAEFQSLIKPVLAETIPYLQATEGLGYQDALLESFKRDPMVQSLYAKYGVQPVRQTKDGSTYLYDPMTFGEIRTKEVKDTSVKDALKIAGIVGLSIFGGGALAGTAAFGGGASAAGTALAKGLTSAGVTALTGGDTNDILKSFALAGAGGYAQGLNANAADLVAKAAENPALLEAANAATNTADAFNKVVAGAKFVDAAIDGNIAGAAISAFGPKFTEAAMNKVGLNEKFLDGYNINQDDVVAGLVKTELELAKGTDFGDAIVRGFGEYIMEGGALGPNNIKTPEFIKKIGDAIAEGGRMFDDVLLQPVKGFVEGTVEVLGDVAEPVVDVIEDVAGAVVEKAPLIEDAVRATGAAVEDVVKPIVEPIIDAAPVVEDAVRAVGSTVDDAIIEPVKELIEEIDLPEVDVDLPEVDVDLPEVDVDLPEVDTSVPTRVPTSFIRTPGILQETGAEIFDLGDREKRRTSADDTIDFLASLGGGRASGGAVRSSYGSLDELLRIVGGK